MVAGAAAGMLLGIPGVSGAAEGSTTSTTAAAPARSGPISDAVDSALKGLVDNSTITQAQSDAVKSAIQDKIGSMPLRGGGPGEPGRRLAKADVLGVASKVLGMTTEEIQTQLRSGSTLAAIAQSKNVDAQKVVDALVADATAKIDQAVTDGKLTADQATQAKANLADRMTGLVNNSRPKGHGGPRRGMGAPPADGATTPTTAASTTSA
jgi:hypothetical protein